MDFGSWFAAGQAEQSEESLAKAQRRNACHSPLAAGQAEQSEESQEAKIPNTIFTNVNKNS